MVYFNRNNSKIWKIFFKNLPTRGETPPPPCGAEWGVWTPPGPPPGGNPGLDDVLASVSLPEFAKLRSQLLDVFIMAVANYT